MKREQIKVAHSTQVRGGERNKEEAHSLLYRKHSDTVSSCKVGERKVSLNVPKFLNTWYHLIANFKCYPNNLDVNLFCSLNGTIENISVI